MDFYDFKKPQPSLTASVNSHHGRVYAFYGMDSTLNQKMQFPDFLKPIEAWMKAKEAEAMRMTVVLLKVNNLGDFLINLFMIALLPAVAEELMFRGGVQRSFKRMFGNPHAGHLAIRIYIQCHPYAVLWLFAAAFTGCRLWLYLFLER